ncbi:peptide-methionine (S)-S-oxide reductase MsrA [Lysobacter sp. 2RAF19]
MHVATEKIVAGAVALGVVGLLLGGLSTIRNPAVAAVQSIQVPAFVETTAAKPSAMARSETVVFAGGCFWGVQGVFQHVKGVQRAVSGYIGGDAASAHYAIVSTGLTGHAEAVQVTYDPSQVSYPQLMQVFFSVVHDPTERNYQGPDHGTQYRSAIYTTTRTQLQDTTAYIAQLQKANIFHAPIVTQVQPARPFYPAEAYHQDYMALNPQAGYIRYWDAPKLTALKATYPALYRATPVLLTQR